LLQTASILPFNSQNKNKMGFTSIILNKVLLTLVLGTVIGLAASQIMLDGYRIGFHDYQQRLTEKHQTDTGLTGFNYTNQSGIDETLLYFENKAQANLKTNCLNLYINKKWVNSTNITYRLKETTFDPLLWNPTETLTVNVSITLDVGEHKAKLVTCQGTYESGLFNASRCPDGECTGGEYCSLDDDACPDNVCYEPHCENGCTETAITDEEDSGECDSSGTGCETDSCKCDEDSDCCGVSGSTGCTDGSDCCSGTCTDGVCG